MIRLAVHAATNNNNSFCCECTIYTRCLLQVQPSRPDRVDQLSLRTCVIVADCSVTEWTHMLCLRYRFTRMKFSTQIVAIAFCVRYQLEKFYGLVWISVEIFKRKKTIEQL